MNFSQILQQSQEYQTRVPAFLNSLASKYESVQQKIRDVIHGENISGKFTSLLNNKVFCFDITELQSKIQDGEHFIQDLEITGSNSDNGESVTVKVTELVASLTDQYQDAQAQTTMYKELAHCGLSEIVDTNSIISRIQSKIGSLRLPTTVQALCDSLPHNATMAQWCSTIGEHASKPASETGWDFSTIDATTGNAIVGALCDIATTVATVLAKLWQGIKQLFKGITALVNAVKEVLQYVGQKLFTNLFVDYEYNGKGQWPSGDIPVARLQWINTSQFFENFRQMCELGGNGYTYLSNEWQLTNNNRKHDCAWGLIPTRSVPNAYIHNVNNPTPEALTWWNKMVSLLNEYHNITIFYNFWMIQVIILDTGEVQMGFFPSTYAPVFDSNDSANQGISTNIEDTFLINENTAQDTGNRLFYYNVLGSPKAWANMARNLPICYEQYDSGAEGSDYDTGWDEFVWSKVNIQSDFPTLDIDSFYSLWYTINALQTDFSASKLASELRDNYYDFDSTDLTLKKWLQNHTSDPDHTESFKRWILCLFALQAARQLSDDAKIQYGEYQNASFVYYKWIPEGEMYPVTVTTTKPTLGDPYWTPYYTDGSTTFMVHVQSNNERIAEWRNAIIAILVAIAAVVVAVKVAKFKKKASIKAQLTDVAYFNAADAYNAVPSKENFKLLKKARRQSNFWQSINDKLCGGASTVSSISTLFSADDSAETTSGIIYYAITGDDALN